MDRDVEANTTDEAVSIIDAGSRVTLRLIINMNIVDAV